MDVDNDISATTPFMGLLLEEVSDELRSFLVSPGTHGHNKEGMRLVAEALALVEGAIRGPQSERDGLRPDAIIRRN